MSPVVDRTPSRFRPAAPFDAADAGVFRIISDPRTPVFVTVHASGRRRYGYWQPYDSRTRSGGCYVALPTRACDELHSTGRILLGDPLEDPGRTTYRVWPARTPVASAHRPAAAVRMSVPPARAAAEPLVA